MIICIFQDVLMICDVKNKSEEAPRFNNTSVVEFALLILFFYQPLYYLCERNVY